MSHELDALAAQMQRAVEQSARGPLEKKADTLRARLFFQQRWVVEDPCKRKAVRCARRTGKTVLVSHYIGDTALRTHAPNILYITGTREQAKQLMWSKLKQIAHEFDLAAPAGATAATSGNKWRFNESELKVYLPDGGFIRLGGAESMSDCDRYRGDPYDLVIIDEAQSILHSVLAYLIDQVLEAAFDDRDGTLAITGTPAPILEGYFYDVTGPTALEIKHGDEDGEGDERRCKARPYVGRGDATWQDTTYEWSLHTWSAEDNTAAPQIWENAKKKKKRKGWADDNPIWLRENMGQWISDESSMVFRYKRERNGWRPASNAKTKTNPFGLPGVHAWRYILGVDPGYDNKCAFQIGAWAETCPQFFQAYGYSRSGMSVTDVADMIRQLEKMLPEGQTFDIKVGDRGGLGKMVFAELERIHGISLDPADKQQRRDHIELVNAELTDGRMMILIDDELEEEMRQLPWKDEKKKHEAEGFTHDNIDAWLYLSTRAQHHFSLAPGEAPAEGSDVWEAARAEAEIEIVEARRRGHEELDTTGTDIVLDEGSGWDSTL